MRQVTLEPQGNTLFTTELASQAPSCYVLYDS